MHNRRDLLRLMALGAASLPFAGACATSSVQPTASAPPPVEPHATAEAAIPNMMGSESIAMLLYPGFTALDLVGPQYFFAGLMGAKVHLVTNQETLAPVMSDTRMAITPTTTIADLSTPVDVLFVPGAGQGVLNAMEHAPTLTFLKDKAANAKWKTSVCTGSLLLAAAGLLKGRKATSHWVARDKLAAFGAIPVDQRVVRDGDIITGAGVSAGIDMALLTVEALLGRPYAQALMLQAEYAPVPPFAGGRPETTPPAIAGAISGLFAPLVAGIDAIAARA